ncbi:MAG: EscF/YscF/HrpA family type III secretion system needle major subunit [Aeromonadales bacterium]|nr:EscF/YscF/HrpA family type III secretion system needle major subunit [Aeromonadales bacterium]MDY2890474.1 EscF/YscF/HrpA family type III secretion system needle major subunit [Succinivibrio sp.]
MVDGMTGSSYATGISNTLDNMSKQAESIMSEMDRISSLSSTEQTTEMIKLNFQIGQYNSMVEMCSSLTKDLTDSLKSIAQKV